jgi:two-component system, OmpR family, KDP operon response regulator KdpE
VSAAIDGFSLQLDGYSVRVAVNASTGLDAAQSRPDLIILDLGLPDMSAVEVLNTIQSRSNVPIIVLSIQVNEEQKVELLRSGADDYVVKPFGIAELAARCEAALRRYHKAVGTRWCRLGRSWSILSLAQ